MKLIVSTSARGDLSAIGRWIADENPVRAHQMVDELSEACKDLLVFPNSNPVIGTFRGRAVRRKVRGSYLIFYAVGEKHLEILRVLHGAQDYADLF